MKLFQLITWKPCWFWLYQFICYYTPWKYCPSSYALLIGEGEGCCGASLLSPVKFVSYPSYLFWSLAYITLLCVHWLHLSHLVCFLLMPIYVDDQLKIFLLWTLSVCLHQVLHNHLDATDTHAPQKCYWIPSTEVMTTTFRSNLEETLVFLYFCALVKIHMGMLRWPKYTLYTRSQSMHITTAIMWKHPWDWWQFAAKQSVMTCWVQ